MVGLLLAYILLCFWVANSIINAPRSVPMMPKQFVVWEPVPKVPAWVSPAVAQGKAKNVFILSHGIKADRYFFADTARELVSRGYDVVLLPMPGHDESPDQYLGFGPKEAKLIKKTVDVLKADHVVLVGCSLGGASTWLASDHPKVDGVVTESAFSHLEPITHIWLDRAFPGGSTVFRPVIWIVSGKLHINPSEVNPAETAAKWDHRKPALVMHAGNDLLIPIAQGHELADVSGAEFWEVPGRSHAQCQDVGKEYVDRIEGVMKRVLQISLTVKQPE
ncbi:MAG: alpha/beta fold hydrolase [Armatimonadota bacterium]